MGHIYPVRDIRVSSCTISLHLSYTGYCSFFGWIVVRHVIVCQRRQFPEGIERLPNTSLIRQHPDDTEDPDCFVLRELTGWNTVRWPADTSPLEHRTSGTSRLEYKSFTSNGNISSAAPQLLFIRYTTLVEIKKNTSSTSYLLMASFERVNWQYVLIDGIN